MGYDQGFPENGLKLKNKMGVLYHDNDWLAGVDYIEDNANLNDDMDPGNIDYENNYEEIINDDDYDENEDENENSEQKKTVNDEEIHDIDEIEQDEDDYEELQEILYETNDDNEETNSDDDEIEIIFENTNNDDNDDDEEVIPLRRSNRIRRPVDRLVPSMTGQSYAQDNTNFNNGKKVTFCDDTPDYSIKKNTGLEKHHNLMTKDRPISSNDVQYTLERAPIIAMVMYQINQEALLYGTSFGQQYILQTGLKKFGEDGYKAAIQELEQMYKRSCFTPIGIGELTQMEK